MTSPHFKVFVVLGVLAVANVLVALWGARQLQHAFGPLLRALGS